MLFTCYIFYCLLIQKGFCVFYAFFVGNLIDNLYKVQVFILYERQHIYIHRYMAIGSILQDKTHIKFLSKYFVSIMNILRSEGSRAICFISPNFRKRFRNHLLTIFFKLHIWNPEKILKIF